MPEIILYFIMGAFLFSMGYMFGKLRGKDEIMRLYDKHLFKDSDTDAPREHPDST